MLFIMDVYVNGYMRHKEIDGITRNILQEVVNETTSSDCIDLTFV
jgi:hypothetical protein